MPVDVFNNNKKCILALVKPPNRRHQKTPPIKKYIQYKRDEGDDDDADQKEKHRLHNTTGQPFVAHPGPGNCRATPAWIQRTGPVRGDGPQESPPQPPEPLYLPRDGGKNAGPRVGVRGARAPQGVFEF